MGSDLPKVLIEVAGRPMIWWVVKACRDARVGRCIVVISQDEERFASALADLAPFLYVRQDQRLGTGHAARQAEGHFADMPPRDVFVLAGDGPLLQAKTLERLLQAHRHSAAAATLATCILTDPTGYGRVLRDTAGQFAGIVEQKDAGEAQRKVCEINASYYCFRSDHLFAGLGRVRDDNKQGEFYLTDVPGLLKQAGQHVCLVDEVPAQDVLSINTPDQLVEVDALLRRRLGET